MMADKKPGGATTGRCNPASGQPGPWTIEPIPAGLEHSPLDFLFADHHRQRQAVQILLNIADGAYNEAGLRNLVKFLEHDFALHIQDEECDFVPLLRRLCPPEDGIDALAERLAGEHADDKSSVKKVVKSLQNRLAGGKLSGTERETIRAFAAHLRRHLAIENGVLLPIARVRMDPDALAELARAIRSRRAKGAQ
ncbi:MAG: hemerythrin domain-containing protein [Alphaproteobacteria bacterium]